MRQGVRAETKQPGADSPTLTNLSCTVWTNFCSRIIVCQICGCNPPGRAAEPHRYSLVCISAESRVGGFEDAGGA